MNSKAAWNKINKGAVDRKMWPLWQKLHFPEPSPFKEARNEAVVLRKQAKAERKEARRREREQLAK